MSSRDGVWTQQFMSLENLWNQLRLVFDLLTCKNEMFLKIQMNSVHNQIISSSGFFNPTFDNTSFTTFKKTLLADDFTHCLESTFWKIAWIPTQMFLERYLKSSESSSSTTHPIIEIAATKWKYFQSKCWLPLNLIIVRKEFLVLKLFPFLGIVYTYFEYTLHIKVTLYTMKKAIDFECWTHL